MDNFSILVVYPHPADSATEASGTVALHAERGDKVTSVVVTDGDRHHMQWLHDEMEKPIGERDPDVDDMTLDDYRQFKRRETERIAEVLGVSELITLGWTDNEIYLDLEKVNEIADIIRRVRPDILITHLPLDTSPGHDDHPITGQIVMSALQVASNRVPQFDGVEPYHGVKQTFFSFAGGAEANSKSFFTSGIIPDVWVDITPVIDKKVQAMDQLVSQAYHGETSRGIAEARDGRWGMIAECAYAEPFLRPSGITYDSLPMPERVIGKEYEPTIKRAGRTTAHKIPSATPPEAYRLKP